MLIRLWPAIARSSRAVRMALAVAAVALLASQWPAALQGQTQGSPNASTATAPGSSAAPAPTQAAPFAFEVSTVKENKTGNGNSSSNTSNGRFTATNVTVRSVIEYQAFGIPTPRIVGGPKWLETEHFDIEAKMDPDVAAQMEKLPHDEREKQSRAMFQQLLADRFKLQTHWETREQPIYNLVVAKKGFTLKPSTEYGSGSSMSSSDTKASFKITSSTLEELAQDLTQECSRELGRVVVDKTGIPGRYDFEMKWTLDNGADPTATDSGPTLLTALQEQLGLRLESAKGPVQVLVIDRLEMPSDN
jgi:uncharacterized protein (TIGR03435 family)